MSEQQRIRKITRRREQPEEPTRAGQLPTGPSEEQRAAEERLNRLDTTINQIVGQPQASAPSEVAGERLRTRMRVLSSEELWRQFRQIGGE